MEAKEAKARKKKSQEDEKEKIIKEVMEKASENDWGITGTMIQPRQNMNTDLDIDQDFMNRDHEFSPPYVPQKKIYRKLPKRNSELGAPHEFIS